MIPARYDPLDLDVHPGLKVRDLTTLPDCTAAVMRLDDEMATIRSQISKAEADPALRPAGWRSSAQNAISWKRRARKAILAHAATIAAAQSPPPRPGIDDKRVAILETIKGEVGEDEFDRLVALAKARHPHLAWGL